MRRMRERYAEMNANGSVPVHGSSRGWMNAFVLPSYVATRFGSGGIEVGEDGQARGRGGGMRSFSEFTSVAPTQEDEDEEWRNMSLCKLSPWCIVMLARALCVC